MWRWPDLLVLAKEIEPVVPLGGSKGGLFKGAAQTFSASTGSTKHKAHVTLKCFFTYATAETVVLV